MASVLLSIAGNVDDVSGHPVSPVIESEKSGAVPHATLASPPAAEHSSATPTVTTAEKSPMLTSSAASSPMVSVALSREAATGQAGVTAAPPHEAATGKPIAPASAQAAESWLYASKKSDSWCAWFSRPWALLLVSMWRDLFALRWYQAAFMFVMMFICILFSFLDINYLVNGPSDFVPTQNRWENTEFLGIEQYKRNLLMLSGVASFTGAMSVVMAAKSRFSTFSWGFINIWTFGAVAWAYGYGGGAYLHSHRLQAVILPPRS